jgi:transposase
MPIRVEDVMTPRNLLKFALSDIQAEKLATTLGFDAVPISRVDGRIREFWSAVEQRRLRIGSAHRTPHDSVIEAVLPRLGDHIIQFVHYRSEVVGLIDASDLNRPTARIAWLQPMLELERAVLDAVRRRGISEDEQAAALGKHAKAARTRQAKARRERLDLPLLEYAQFGNLLAAARTLKLVEIDDASIDRLNEVRKRAAHSGDLVVENRGDCSRLLSTLKLARSYARQLTSTRARERARRTTNSAQ